jgi:hypothetical protein
VDARDGKLKPGVQPVITARRRVRPLVPGYQAGHGLSERFDVRYRFVLDMADLAGVTTPA